MQSYLSLDAREYRGDYYEDDVFRGDSATLAEFPRACLLAKTRGSDSQYSSMSSGADSSPESPKRTPPPLPPVPVRSVAAPRCRPALPAPPPLARPSSAAPPHDLHLCPSPVPSQRSVHQFYEADAVPAEPAPAAIHYLQVGEGLEPPSQHDEPVAEDTTQQLTHVALDMADSDNEEAEDAGSHTQADNSLLANTPRNVHLYRSRNVDCVMYDVQ